MDNLLNTQSICHSKCFMDSVEECGFNGDYTLPEYCPDIAVVLKCLAEPHLQSRQFSADKLLLDGMVNLRVVYLDEGRRHIHSVEFTVPYSCALRNREEEDTTPVFFDFTTKYVNCRATNPRRLEVHGAVQVRAQAYGNYTEQVAVPAEKEGLYLRRDTVEVSKLVGTTEKVVTISEVLEFPQSQPAAEMLLGGTCTAMVTEWKVLNGKVIARGTLLIHQLYTDNQESGTTQCLDYEVPFSQILDVSGVHEGHLCCGDVQVLSDTERCTVGPDGENTLLEITVKLMLQLCVYESGEMPLILESYHTQHPVEQDFEEIECKAYCGCRSEQTTLPMLVQLPENHLQELLDVWVCPQNAETAIQGHVVSVCGTLLVSVLGRDADGEIVYFEKGEEYRLEYPCDGNELEYKVKVSDLRYRVVDNKLELQVGLWVWLHQYQTTRRKMIRSLRLNTEQCYPKTKSSALLYYAQPGESLWAIARDCHTSPEAIRNENELVAEKIENSCVILVPIV